MLNFDLGDPGIVQLRIIYITKNHVGRAEKQEV